MKTIIAFLLFISFFTYPIPPGEPPSSWFICVEGHGGMTGEETHTFTEVISTKVAMYARQLDTWYIWNSDGIQGEYETTGIRTNYLHIKRISGTGYYDQDWYIYCTYPSYIPLIKK